MDRYEQFKQMISKCKTNKQVIKVIKDAGYEIVKDDSEELGTFSVWLSDTLRIYRTLRKEYVVQKWKHVEVKYSEIPTFFGTDSIF